MILTHTGMRVPHDRMRVSSLDRRPTPTGTAYTATLQVDGQPAGTITNDGNGGPTELHTTHPQLGPDRMAAYVRHCRHHGQPPSEQQVLDALITEYDHAEQTRQAIDNGATMVRLLDDDENLVHLRPVWPAPRGHLARVQLGHHLNRRHQHPSGATWQIWSGTGWQHLTQTPTDPADSDHSATGARGEVNPMRVFAYVIADALLDGITREALVAHAAEHGIPLDPHMSEAQIRAAVRDHNSSQARRAGLPVDDLPTLSADEGLELGRRLSGGAADPAP